MKRLLLTLAIAACGPPLEPQYPGNDCFVVEDLDEPTNRLLQCRGDNYVWEIGRFYGTGDSKVWVPEHWEKQ